MTNNFGYNQVMDVRYKHQEVIDIKEVVDNCKDNWFNQTLTELNDSLVRIGIIQGEYHWHKHENEDEFFFVLEGTLILEIEGHGSVTLNPHQGITITKGLVHRPIAKERVVMLMVEKSTVDPMGVYEK